MKLGQSCSHKNYFGGGWCGGCHGDLECNQHEIYFGDKVTCIIMIETSVSCSIKWAKFS